ncbi:MAG: hypothetical protein ACR2NU_04775 [Aeoliella sp.]
MASGGDNQLANGDMQAQISRAAFAFRGYNLTNLGRTPELWEVDAYRPTLQNWLDLGSSVCESMHGGKTDLAARVVGHLEADLEHYAEAVALVMSIELAQIELLRELHGVNYSESKLAFGYSLGELTAVAANEITSPDEAMQVPVGLAHDCAALARDVTLGILFSRTEAIDEAAVGGLCEEITSECNGVIGVSAMLSPNSFLVLGQGDTLSRFKIRMADVFPKSAHLKRDSHHWPPLHTPIVRQRHVPDRASVMMEKMSATPGLPKPTLFSLATGAPDYGVQPVREILRRWIDHPQRLWDAVVHTLSEDVSVMIHVGPAPNVIPATFHRLSDNVGQQLEQLSLKSLGKRAISGLAGRRWLANLLPTSASLLRAPTVEHVILEDWLLENAPQ